jgi:hypothetical protein
VVEISMRCAVDDRPGALAHLAGAIAAVGADIEAVDVVDAEGGKALDDLVVVVRDPGHLRELLAALERLDDVEVVHAGPSRGHPGDAVTRMAVGLQSILNGAMDPERGVTTLLAGLLRADDVTIVPREEAPPEADGLLLVPMPPRVVVVRRAYAFCRTEEERALALVRACAEIGTTVR